MGRDALELKGDHADDLRALGDVVDDAEQLFDREHVAGLVGHAREIVHAGHEGHALCPGAELHVLLDAGVQVADAAARLGHRLAVELEDESEHAVGRRVLRTHVDDDALLVARGRSEDGVPVGSGDREDTALAGLVCLGVRVCERVVVAGVEGALVGDVGHQEYDLRWSGGGMVAPLYSTGMPPSG